jgi:hypothetical protein
MYRAYLDRDFKIKVTSSGSLASDMTCKVDRKESIIGQVRPIFLLLQSLD